MRLYTLWFFASFLLIGIVGALQGASLITLAARHAIPVEQSGLIITFNTVGGIIGTLLIGRLLDRMNSRWLCAMSLAIIGVAAFGTHFAPAALWLIISMMALGMGFGMLIVSGNVVMARMHPIRAAVLLNVLNMCYSIGGIVGPQIGRAALQQGTVTLAYLVVSLGAVVVVPLLLTGNVPPPPMQARMDAPRVAWIELVPVMVLLFLYVGAEIGFSAWISTQLSEAAGLSAADATFGLSLFWGALTVGRVVSGAISVRVPGSVLVIIAPGIMAAGAALILGFPTSGVISLIGTALVGLGCAPMFPTSIALVNNAYPQAGGVISGVLITCGSVGATLIPWLHGQIGRGVNGGMIVTLIVAMCLIGVAFVIRLRAVVPTQPIRSPL